MIKSRTGSYHGYFPVSTKILMTITGGPDLPLLLLFRAENQLELLLERAETMHEDCS